MSDETGEFDRNLFVEAPWHFNRTGADGRARVLETLDWDTVENHSTLGQHRVVSEPLYFSDGSLAGRSALVDSRDKTRLYSVIGDGAPVVQYWDTFASPEVRALFEKHGIKIVSAGTLRDGGMAFMSGQLPESVSIIHRDGRNHENLRYVTVVGAHGGQIARGLTLELHQTVCRNTMPVLSNQRSRTVRLRGSIAGVMARWTSAVEGIDGLIEQSKAQAAMTNILAQTPMHAGEWADFSASLLLDGESRSKVERDAMLALFGDPGLRPEAIHKVQLALADPDQNHARTIPATDLGIGDKQPIARRSANLFVRRFGTLGKAFGDTTVGNAGADRADALDAVTFWVTREGVRDFRGTDTDKDEKRYVSQLLGDGRAMTTLAFERLTEMAA